METENMLQCLVADSAAFLKNAQLHKISCRIFTIQEVISEIKDSATRQRLSVLPYTIEFREPSTESIRTVTEFSKKTGDFQSLSAVDIKVMALTYQLEKEFGNADRIKKEPEKKVQCVTGGGFANIKPEHGFVFGSKKEVKRETNHISTENCVSSPKQNEEEPGATDEGKILQSDVSLLTFVESCKKPDQEENLKLDVEEHEKNDVDIENSVESEEDQESFLDDQIEDDNFGWITPRNISRVKKEMGYEEVDETSADVKNACLTTDFAMQNVLMQMGLHVISLDGMIIRQARSYILKCYGCSKETTEMERVFCKKCGNKTLRKVSVSVNADGSLTYHLPKRRRPFNLRGTKYSIPLPKPGRHANNVILAEDQKQSMQRMPKSKDTMNAFDADFIARTSPFAYKDVTSKAFNKGFHLKQNSRRNPNEGKRTKSKRK